VMADRCSGGGLVLVGSCLWARACGQNGGRGFVRDGRRRV
jgi:hypothetical protein